METPMFKFHEGDQVRLTAEYTELGLVAGDTGTMWVAYATKPASYEVTFQSERGEAFDLTLSEDELAAVRPARRTSKRSTARGAKTQ
jgi:hypothetical protein